MAAEEWEAAEFDWSCDNTSQLITLYETFPCLYDVRSKDHKNRDMRDKALVEIAAKLGTTSAEVLKKIKGLLTQYSRERAKGNKKPKSGSARDDVTPVSNWVHLEQLRFLSEYITLKSSKSNLSNKDNKSEDNEDGIKCHDEDDGIDEEPVDSKSTKKPTRNRNRESKRGEEDNVLKNALTIMEQTSANLKKKRPVEAEDCDFIFAKYIATEIKDIENEKIKKLVKNRIQNIIFEAQSTLNPEQVHYQPHQQIGWSHNSPMSMEGFERHFSVSPVHSDCSPPSGASSFTKL